MKPIFFIILLYSSIALTAQQSTNIDFFKKQNFDKVTISKYSIKNKTSSTPSFDLEAEIKEEKKKIYERDLTRKEICKLFRVINHTKKTHILEDNYDVEITFLKNDSIVQDIHVSSFSKNIKIKTNNCKTQDGLYPCLYLGSLSSKIDRFIRKLLAR